MKTRGKSKQELFRRLDGMKITDRFQSDELSDSIERRTNEHHQSETIRRYLREYRQKTGRIIICVDKAKSIYEVVA